MLKFATEYKVIFEVISCLVVIGSIPTAILSFYMSKRKEISDREYGTFDSLDDKFIEFQMICLDKPYLNIFDVEDENPVELTPLQKKEEIIAYAVLFAIFERAYVMYKARNFKDTSGQWEGWEEVMIEYAKRDNFIEAWEKNGFGWDENFTKYLCEEILPKKEDIIKK